jgi:hypothetical protein
MALIMGQPTSFRIMYVAIVGVVMVAATTAGILGGLGAALFAGVLALVGGGGAALLMRPLFRRDADSPQRHHL